MIEIKIEKNKRLGKLEVIGTKHDIALEFYDMFEGFLATKGLDQHFKAALFSYLEVNNELLNEFLEYHNDDRTKKINDIIDKIYGDDDK